MKIHLNAPLSNYSMPHFKNQRQGVTSPTVNAKVSLYKNLSEIQKTQVYQLFDTLPQKTGGSIFPTVLGVNGASYFKIKPDEYETFEHIAKICSSNQIHIIIGKEKNFQGTPEKQRKSMHKPVFIIHVTKQKQMLKERLEYYKQALMNPNLNVETLYEHLTSLKSPLMDVEKNPSIMGHFLGYPVTDVILFDLKNRGVLIPENEKRVNTPFVQWKSWNAEHYQAQADQEARYIEQEIQKWRDPNSRSLKKLFHYLISLNVNKMV